MDNQPRRKLTRLAGFDYSQAGAYFVTICTEERTCTFGSIVNGEMGLNDAGVMVHKWWLELESKYPSVTSDAFVVMPNHMHGTITLVGAPLRGRLLPPHGSPSALPTARPHRAAPTLGSLIRWFKTMTTNAYIRGVKFHGWPPFPGRLWQRNYYEHVIRNEDDLFNTRRYIENNPLQWDMDEENPNRQ